MQLGPSPVGLVSLWEVGLRTQTQKRGHARARGGGGICKWRGEASEGTSSAGTLILAFQPPEPGGYASAVSGPRSGLLC